MTVPLERSLVVQLDPERDYGSRTYEQVVSEIQAGTLVIEQPAKAGYLPILRDASTRVVVKGSGPASVNGGPTRGAALHAMLIDWLEQEGLELAVLRLHEVITGGKDGDAVKAIEVLFKHVLPKQREAAPDTGSVEALMDALRQTRPATARDADLYELTRAG